MSLSSARRNLGLVAAFAAGALACDRAGAPVVCLAYAAPSLAVSVFDSTTGAGAVGALVTASDGAYLDSARVSPYGPSVGLAYERPGTYLVTVSKEGCARLQMSGVVAIARRAELRAPERRELLN